jgi:hypothetical protein
MDLFTWAVCELSYKGVWGSQPCHCPWCMVSDSIPYNNSRSFGGCLHVLCFGEWALWCWEPKLPYLICSLRRVKHYLFYFKMRKPKLWKVQVLRIIDLISQRIRIWVLPDFCLNLDISMYGCHGSPRNLMKTQNFVHSFRWLTDMLLSPCMDQAGDPKPPWMRQLSLLSM